MEGAFHMDRGDTETFTQYHFAGDDKVTDRLRDVVCCGVGLLSGPPRKAVPTKEYAKTLTLKGAGCSTH
jgi:hypothetical protein